LAKPASIGILAAMTKLSKDQCLSAIASGEFGTEILGAVRRVAVVLTQGWCPQWVHLRRKLESLSGPDDPAVFWVEYDVEPFFDEFMAWKEEVLGNREVPYVRYYRDGTLVAESNYTDLPGFLARFGRD